MITDDLTEIRDRIDEIVEFSRDLIKELNDLKVEVTEQKQRLVGLENSFVKQINKKKK